MSSQLPLFQPPKSRGTLSNDIWRACNILRRGNNCGGVMEYVEDPRAWDGIGRASLAGLEVGGNSES